VIDIQDRILLLREKLKLTQDQFAIKSGISRATLAKIENKAQKPTLECINTIVNEFHITYDWIMAGKGEIFTEKSYKIEFNSKQVDEPENNYGYQKLMLKRVDRIIELLEKK